MGIRALIVDDEPLARSRIRTLLRMHQDVDVIAECSNGDETARVVREERPDLLFLDMELPGLNGLQTLAALPSPPAVIFVTAHETFALEAFEANAVDYLVKPFSQARFDRALHRARRLIGEGGTLPAAAAETERRPRDRFAIRVRGQIVFVKSDSIDWIGAEGNYARLHTADAATYLLRESLQHLEGVLDAQRFLRVHRSAIVNIERVQKLVAGPDSAFSIVLQNGTAVPLGPTYRENLENLLGQKL